MRNFMAVFLCQLLWLSNPLFAQVIFSNEILLAQLNDVNPSSINSSDIDNDGDTDIFAAFGNNIVWFENLDGQGNFSIQQIITDSANSVQSIFIADIDGDEDDDVLSASEQDNEIAWYENVDGQGSFGAKWVITDSVDGVRSVYAKDLDNDGDMDVLSASFSDKKIAWYKNTNGQGNFSEQRVISNSFNGAIAVYSADIDNDGDMDVICGSYLDDKIVWYENIDSQGNYGTERIISTFADGVFSLFVVDLDNDGDMDVLSALFLDNAIAWYENIDGQGTFGSQQIISNLVDDAQSVATGDIDSDGDLDVLSASRGDNIIAWHENIDSQGNFGVQHIISNTAAGPILVHAKDIDNDGDIDVVSGTGVDEKIVWYRNLSPTIIEASPNPLNTFELYQNYPNPFNPKTTIHYNILFATFVKLEIYNTKGEKIVTLINQQQSAGSYSVNWDGKDNIGKQVASGVYIYLLESEKFSKSMKMVLIQ